MNAEAIKNFYNKIAKQYEIANHVLTLSLDKKWRRATAEIAKKHGGSLWVDVCTGTGETIEYLKKCAPPETMLVGVDFSDAMLDVAKSKKNLSGVEFITSPVDHIPLEENSADIITITFATRNISLKEDYLISSLKEFRRILRPGGIFICLETSQPENKFIKYLFHTYVKLLVVPVGFGLTKHESPYKYLVSSIIRHYDADRFSEIIRRSGFSHVEYSKMILGAIAIHRAIK